MNTRRSLISLGILSGIVAVVALLTYPASSQSINGEDKAPRYSDSAEESLEKALIALAAVEGKEADEARKYIEEALVLIEEEEQARQETANARRGTRLGLPRSPQAFGSNFDDPFDSFYQMQQRMDMMMGEMMRGFDDPMFGGSSLLGTPSPRSGLGGSLLGREPQMDIELTEENVVVQLDMPGLDKENINVQSLGQALLVEGRQNSELVQSDEDGSFLRRERHVGNFSRTIPLPVPIKAGEIDASYEDGVLTITAPRLEREEKPMKVIIK